MVAQVKEGLYHNQHPTNTFLPLAIKVFGCLHQQVDNFSHQCASMVCLAKGTDGLPLEVFCAFYGQRMSIAWQKMHITSIFLSALSLQVGVSLDLLCFQVSLPFPSLICLL